MIEPRSLWSWQDLLLKKQSSSWGAHKAIRRWSLISTRSLYP